MTGPYNNIVCFTPTATSNALRIIREELGKGREIEIPSLHMKLSWRPDGWPLCPSCGEDELYSLLNWNGDGDKPPLEEWVRAGLCCYRCGWRGES